MSCILILPLVLSVGPGVASGSIDVPGFRDTDFAELRSPLGTMGRVGEVATSSVHIYEKYPDMFGADSYAASIIDSDNALRLDTSTQGSLTHQGKRLKTSRFFYEKFDTVVLPLGSYYTAAMSGKLHHHL